jgi:hypothetical protein
MIRKHLPPRSRPLRSKSKPTEGRLVSLRCQAIALPREIGGEDGSASSLELHTTCEGEELQGSGNGWQDAHENIRKLTRATERHTTEEERTTMQRVEQPVITTWLERIEANAQGNRELKFTSIAHHVTEELLWESVRHIPSGSTLGMMDTRWKKGRKRPSSNGSRRCSMRSMTSATRHCRSYERSRRTPAKGNAAVGSKGVAQTLTVISSQGSGLGVDSFSQQKLTDQNLGSLHHA